LSQRQSVFGEEIAERIGSMALIPIGPGADRAVLGLASAEAARFAPGISTDFLERIGELLSAALARTDTPTNGQSAVD
jgi:uncharacterized protein YigA (DUF484 family)